MAKYVRNDTGAIHSVDDSFEVPEGWEEVDEATARTEHPELLGDAPAETPAESDAPAPVETEEVGA